MGEDVGCVVREALNAVREAIHYKNIILQVRFEWVKYIVYCSNRGWYAGFIIVRESTGLYLKNNSQCSTMITRKILAPTPLAIILYDSYVYTNRVLC